LEEGMGRLQEDARAVAGVILASASATMVQIDENIEGLAARSGATSCL